MTGRLRGDVTFERLLSFLGLAVRAGKVLSGTDAVSIGMKSGEVFLILFSEDLSDRSKRKILELTEYYRIPCKVLKDSKVTVHQDIAEDSKGNRNDLGRSIGKPDRKVCGITDKNFSSKLLSMLEEMSETECKESIKTIQEE